MNYFGLRRMQILNKKFTDEREEKNIIKALAKGAIVVQLLLGAKALYEIVSGVATLSTTGIDVGILIIMNLVIIFNLYRSKTISTPVTLLGRKLTTDMTPKAKIERRNKYYVPEAILSAVGLSFGSYFSSGYSGLGATIVLFIIYYIISFIATTKWNEHNIKRYHADLED